MVREHAKSVENVAYEDQYHMMINTNRDVYTAYVLYFGYLPLPVVTVTAVLTLTYAWTVSKEIIARRVSRKCYLLILNRAIGDLLCCVFFFMLCLYIITVPQSDIKVRHLDIIGTFGSEMFWSVAVSYVSLSVLKFFAVFRPLHYRRVITVKRCAYLIVFSWIIYGLFVVSTLTILLLSTVPYLKRWSGCRLSTCMQRLMDSENIIFFLLYVFTIVIFIATAVFIKKARTPSILLQSSKKRKRTRGQKSFPLWKLTINVSTFATFNFVYIIHDFLFGYEEVLRWYDRSAIRYYGILWTSFVLRITVDGIIGLLIDSQIRHGAFRLFGCISDSHPQKSRRANSTASINPRHFRHHVDGKRVHSDSNSLLRKNETIEEESFLPASNVKISVVSISY